MKNIRFKAHILPHLIAVIAFFAVTALFFKPVVLNDKVMEQHDIKQWRGGAQELMEYRERTGEEGLWTNSMFSGMPAYLVNTQWSDTPVKYVKTVISLWIEHPVNNIMVAFICYYILLLSFGVRPYLAIGGAIAFGLSSFNIIGLAAGHNARIGAIAFMPLVIAGVHITFTRSRLLGFGVTALGTALHLMENHLQITYYLLLILIIYGIVQLVDFIKKKQIKPLLIRSGICIAAALIALTAFAGKFWSTWEYSQYSMRGPSEISVENNEQTNEDGLAKNYAFQYSNGIFEPLTLMIPNILGGSSGDLIAQDENSEVIKELRRANDPQMANQLYRYTAAYWGNQPYTAPYYIGAIICLLFIIGILFAGKKYVTWLCIVAALGVVLSWGDNFSTFNYFMFDYFPGYNKFRSVTFTLIMPILAMPLLGMIGLERLIYDPWVSKIKKKLLIAFSVAAGLCLLIVLLSGMIGFTREGENQLPQWFLEALRSDRRSLLISDTFRTLFFIIIAGALIWLAKLNRLSFTVMAVILSFLITIDLWSVDKRYFGEENYRRRDASSFTQMLPVDQAIKRFQQQEEKDHSQGLYGTTARVYNLQGAWSEARTSMFHKSIGGYHGAKLRRMQDLYNNCIENETTELINNLRSGSRDMSEFGVLNMLNARFLTFGGEQNNFLVNKSALGHAWLVENIIRVRSADEEILQTCNINTSKQAVVDVSKFNVASDNFSSEGSVTMTEYAPNKIVYNADLNGSSFVVFSEVYYPVGWTATIDGEPAEIIRANYVLRALEVPAGSHTITFIFRPESYYTGDKITMAGSWLVILIFLGSVIGSVIRFSKHQPHTDR